jgi:hypothetical protein
VADTFSLAGSYQSTPAFGSPSGVGSIIAPIDEELVLTEKFYDSIDLSTDAPFNVSFGGGVTQAAVVILKAIGGKVRVRVTSTDGSQQSFPLDSFAVIMSVSVPITAIDLTRVPGTATTVDVFLGQNS